VASTSPIYIICHKIAAIQQFPRYFLIRFIYTLIILDAHGAKSQTKASQLGTFYPQKFNFVEKQAKVKQKVQWVYIHKEHFNIA